MEKLRENKKPQKSTILSKRFIFKSHFNIEYLKAVDNEKENVLFLFNMNLKYFRDLLASQPKTNFTKG